MSRSPATVAQRRIQSELNEWLSRPPEGCRLIDFDSSNMMQWFIELKGPDQSPTEHALYRGQIFKLRITFTDRYPLEPPEVVFIPTTPIHPHIYSNGHICLDILYDSANGGWSPALTISQVVLSLHSMLASNTELQRPPGDQEYCIRMRGRSPKETRWEFEDDKV